MNTFKICFFSDSMEKMHNNWISFFSDFNFWPPSSKKNAKRKIIKIVWKKCKKNQNQAVTLLSDDRQWWRLRFCTWKPRKQKKYKCVYSSKNVIKTTERDNVRHFTQCFFFFSSFRSLCRLCVCVCQCVLVWGSQCEPSRKLKSSQRKIATVCNVEVTCIHNQSQYWRECCHHYGIP